MVKIAGAFAAVLLAYGLAPAPARAQQASTSGTVNVQSWTGTLVDANCAGGSGTAAAQAPAENNQKAVDSGRPEKGHKKAHGAAESCAANSSTTTFALRTKDGHVMKFDAVGNARAAEEVKTKASWSRDAAAGKPIRAKVTGMLSGDNITVTSITGRFSMG